MAVSRFVSVRSWHRSGLNFEASCAASLAELRSVVGNGRNDLISDGNLVHDMSQSDLSGGFKYKLDNCTCLFRSKKALRVYQSRLLFEKVCNICSINFAIAYKLFKHLPCSSTFNEQLGWLLLINAEHWMVSVCRCCFLRIYSHGLYSSLPLSYSYLAFQWSPI